MHIDAISAPRCALRRQIRARQLNHRAVEASLRVNNAATRARGFSLDRGLARHLHHFKTNARNCAAAGESPLSGVAAMFAARLRG
jgi:hypothetical protein